MGYDVHITRKGNWYDEGGPAISLKEWTEYLSHDSDMRLDGYAEAKVGGGSLRMESTGLAVWTGYPAHTEGERMAWFDYRQGNVTVKNPDDEILRKMSSIASRLSARVQGDDCEFYDGARRMCDPATLQPAEPPEPAKPWWRFW
jgi:hypothetical protein